MLKDHSVISPIITPLADMSMAGWGVSSREIATCQDRTRDRIEIGAFEEKKNNNNKERARGHEARVTYPLLRAISTCLAASASVGTIEERKQLHRAKHLCNCAPVVGF